jgi:hypothetical protein
LLDDIAVVLGVDLPIDVTQLMTGGILDILSELNGAAAMWRAVQAGDDALDEGLGLEVKVPEGFKRLGVKIGGGLS